MYYPYGIVPIVKKKKKVIRLLIWEREIVVLLPWNSPNNTAESTVCQTCRSVIYLFI